MMLTSLSEVIVVIITSKKLRAQSHNVKNEINC